MGLGDEIMVTGDVVAMQQRDPRPVCIVDKRGNPRWHEIWEHNPRLTQRPEGAQLYVNAWGRRPYIDPNRSNKKRWVFREDYRAKRGEIYLTDEERAAVAGIPAGSIIVEPLIKPGAPLNKDWGWNRWQRLATLLREQRAPGIVQIGPGKPPLLKGAQFHRTSTFRIACAALERASVAILPEGGLHHAAAALHVPAVVIFGGYISPRTTGYDGHVNLYTGNLGTLGWRTPHPDCAKAMAKITPEEVAGHALDIIAQKASAA